ncbi:MAG: porin family protein [Thiotrichales bacterium]|jgi:long-subunit fatty acid transport protein|nr:porin family protein [Thiotrichales bacterium]MBT7869476.1 porin family protein [Thiotrichales bacterium]
MKTSLITVGVSIALASSMGTAVAGGDSPFYLTGGLQNSNFDLNINTAGISVDDSASGFNLAVGYEINDNWSIEGGYSDIGEIGASASAAGSTTYSGKTLTYNGSIDLKVDSDAFTLAPVFTYQASDKLYLHATAGMMWWDADATLTGNAQYTYDGTTTAANETYTAKADGEDGFYGAGATYAFDESMGVRGSWSRTDVEGVDIDTFGVNLVIDM